MDPREFIDRIAGTVRAFLALAGRGSHARTARRIGASSSYFRVMLPAGLPLRKLAATIEALEIEPALFFARAFGNLDPLEHFRADARLIRQRKRGDRPTLAHVRLKYRAGDLRLEPEDDADEKASARARLEKLDDLRYQDLTQASIGAAKAARNAGDVHTAARALGVWASCLRMRRELDDATLALDVALELAGGHPPIRGDLIQRAVYVVAEQGEYERALALANKALLSYVEMGKSERIGQTLVDRAVMLYQLGLRENALRSYSRSLDYLPKSARRHRAAAFQGLGRCHYELGSLKLAKQAAQEALSYLPSKGATTGHVLWLLAAIAEARGAARQAEAFYHQALDQFTDLPDEALLAAAQLVRLLHRSGRATEGCKHAKSLVWLVEPLEGDRVLQACLADLVRAGMEGERALTLELVDATIQTVERFVGGPGRPPTKASNAR